MIGAGGIGALPLKHPNADIAATYEGSNSPAVNVLPRTHTYSITAGGLATDICINEFSDRWFIIITQCGKIGTMIDCCVDDPNDELYSARVLLGDRSKKHHLAYARRITEVVRIRSLKPILLGITVLDDSPAVFQEVIGFVEALFRSGDGNLFRPG